MTTTDLMLVADSLIEYAIKHIEDAALFGRAVEVLRKLEYVESADALNRYRASMTALLGEGIVDRINLYSVKS